VKAIKGLRFYTYQEAANWLECSVPEVEEMVAHKELLAYRFRNEKEPYISEQALFSSGPDPWYSQREVPVA
jgi:excisionase family DNA binding protein